jgi:hypothetical protein
MTREDFIKQLCAYGMKEENAIKFWDGAREGLTCCGNCRHGGMKPEGAILDINWCDCCDFGSNWMDGMSTGDSK